MIDRPKFLFITCQIGAENAVKAELAQSLPAAHPAYARPGFLTFKLPDLHFLPPDFDLHSVFARAAAFSLGKVAGSTREEMIQGVSNLAAGKDFQRIHVWERDAASPGDHDFDPGVTPQAEEIAADLLRHSPSTMNAGAADLRSAARPGELVLDCVVVQPNEWWVGFHQAKSVESRWPGGLMSLALPPDAVSRAWLKMEEALRWSQLPIPPGAHCAELGAAPGGASQALLGRGLWVVGVDPAEIHAAVADHPQFTHVRKRVTQVRRRAFASVRWIMADMNVAPNYTLDAVEGIVTHPAVSVNGLILTLKLFDWAMAAELPGHLERVRSWGFSHVKARQLQHNRQEVCVAALKEPLVRKPRAQG